MARIDVIGTMCGAFYRHRKTGELSFVEISPEQYAALAEKDAGKPECPEQFQSDDYEWAFSAGGMPRYNTADGLPQKGDYFEGRGELDAIHYGMDGTFTIGDAAKAEIVKQQAADHP